ncbi:thioredoxin domain protein [Staphylococcus phage PG-2021_27]
MKEIESLIDLGVTIDNNKDLLVLFTKNNCPQCELFKNFFTPYIAQGNIETKVVMHNIESDDMDTAIAMYDLSSTPTLMRFKDGVGIDKDSGLTGLTPDRVAELDKGSKE